MSTWKKVSEATRRKHHERGQHADRMHLGMLEKHPDYKIRADDFNQKRRTIFRLRKAALDRNPDEFYFNMVNTKQRNGVHQLKRPIRDFTDDELRLIRQSDRKYVDFRLRVEQNKLDKLMSAANSVQPSGKIIRFFETDDEAKRAAAEAVASGTTRDLATTRKANEEIAKRKKRVDSLTKVLSALRNPTAYVDVMKKAMKEVDDDFSDVEDDVKVPKPILFKRKK